jgi:chromosome segregation ATPase
MSHEQLLQLCRTQAVDNKALKVSMQWLAASRDASTVSSKEEAARQATIIAELQADNASLRTTNASQTATISCLKKQAYDLQQQLGSAQCGAGKWRASYALLKTQTDKKYAALPQESAAVIDKWAAHCKELQQQAEKAAAELHTRCAELTSQLSSFQALQSEHKGLVTSSNQLQADHNVLCERLDRRDAVISEQRLQLHQLLAAVLTPAAAAAQKVHRRNESSGYRSRRQASPRTLTQSRLSACSSATTAAVCLQQCHNPQSRHAASTRPTADQLAGVCGASLAWGRPCQAGQWGSGGRVLGTEDALTP